MDSNLGGMSSGVLLAIDVLARQVLRQTAHLDDQTTDLTRRLSSADRFKGGVLRYLREIAERCLLRVEVLQQVVESAYVDVELAGAWVPSLGEVIGKLESAIPLISGKKSDRKKAAELLRECLKVIRALRKDAQDCHREAERRGVRSLVSSSGKDAFACHNSNDREVVHDICNELHRRKVAVWIDMHGIGPGDRFWSVIEEALEYTASHLVFLGPNGQGPTQKDEIEVIRGLGKRIIPIILPDGNIDNFPRWLRGNHYVDFSAGITKVGLDQLAEAILRKRQSGEESATSIGF